MSAPEPGRGKAHGGVSRPRWCQVRNGEQRHKGGGRCTGRHGLADNLPISGRTNITLTRSVADSDGAMVARSQILVSGSTATLLGTMTNETGFDVYFSGMPPYAVSFDADGSETILLGDFSSQPREQPSRADWVMHPGAIVPYRSLPVTLRTPDARWDGTHWCTSSRSTTLDITFCIRRELPTIQLFNGAYGSGAA